jgi:GNAT superfamily N-acetyltransferase
VVSVEQVPVEAVRPLRLRVLRPDWAPESVVYPEDSDPSATHFGAFVDSRLVGTLSLYAEPPPYDASTAGWRMRGVAVDPTVQRQGAGRALVAAAEGYAEARGSDIVWCNGRVSAQQFYESLGYQQWGDVFDSVGVPHIVMWRRLRTVPYADR